MKDKKQLLTELVNVKVSKGEKKMFERNARLFAKPGEKPNVSKFLREVGAKAYPDRRKKVKSKKKKS